MVLGFYGFILFIYLNFFFFLSFYYIFFVFVLCLVCPLLPPVSLGYLFLIVPSVFSNVYYSLLQKTLLTIQSFDYGCSW